MFDTATAATAAPSTDKGPAAPQDTLKDSLSDPLEIPQLDTGRPGADAPQLASEGTSGSGGEMPFRSQIQSSFGDHDISGISVHTDSKADEANKAMGSTGFAVGGSIGLSSGYDLHTVAHEAAHAVAQKSGKGVSLYGGPDSPSERFADAVADKVVAGESASGLLDNAPSGGGNAPQFTGIETWDSENEEWVDASGTNQDAFFRRVPEMSKKQQKTFEKGILQGDLSVEGIAKTPPETIAAISPKGPVPRKVLHDTLGQSWDEAKTKLAKGKPPTGVGRSPKSYRSAQKSMQMMMQKIWEYRQWHHDEILQQTKSQLDGEVGATGLSNWIAAGSTTLTSDIDVNLKGTATEKAVTVFNEKFKADGWSYEAGVVYDVNVYALDFMHGKGEVDSDGVRSVSKEGKRKGRKEGGVEDDDKALVDQQNQEGWALAKMRIYMTGDEWSAYKTELLDACPVDKKPELLSQFMDAHLKYTSYRKTLKKEMQRQSGEVLSAGDTATKSGYALIQEQAAEGAGGHGAGAEDLAIASSNRIYEKKLAKVATRRGRLKRDIDQYNGLVDDDGNALDGDTAFLIAGLKSRIDSQLVSLRELIAECALYSNEAYLTDGAVNHTVVGLQMGKDITQTQGESMNAIHENMADTLKEIGRHGDTMGEAAYKSGKYMWRMADAAKNMGFGAVANVGNLYEAGYEIAHTIKGSSKAETKKKSESAAKIKATFGTSMKTSGDLKSKVRGIGMALMKKYNNEVRGESESESSDPVTKAKH